jgi:dihydroorotase
MENFTMRMPDDFHLHLRDGNTLRAVLPHTARQFKRALIMPNTELPVLNERDVERYRDEIIKASHDSGFPGFEPLMTIQITESTSPALVPVAIGAGAIAGKIYPRGMTTNSENGVYDYKSIYPVLRKMEEYQMLALFHGESPKSGVFCLDREVKFLRILRQIAAAFPRLKIVMEHVTTERAVECVLELPENVAATITVHHLFLTLDDVIGGKLKPHHFCKPVAKRPMDRRALFAAATSGNPKFFLGTDSAPHLKSAKECAEGCAGVFTAPVAPSSLIELFEKMGQLDSLENFCSGFGADFYELPRNQGEVTFIRDEWTVPATYDGIVPFRAGEKLQWWMQE